MEIIVISLVLLVLGALFVIPRSNGREILELYKGGINPQYKEGLLDLWVIINDKVYDVTLYVDEHPGGEAILNNVGDDSTEGFFGPQHDTRVFDIIEDFCIGRLKD